MGIFGREYAGALTWESIKSKGNGGGPQYTYRAKVKGGWLVETENYAGNCGGLAFVPDANHEWILESL
ncbi:hypothetical protein [Photobacterium damselae]|uniref:hypothetical protein n=1 Tax=Photobacterium damselae TaxID=38293 RepID=UPI00083AD1B3|nr:hypothetical protein [Photobacterium damselae]KAB1175034.1 hypothetical protein F6477_19585 [Photobacterium damselae subsp. damselae]NVO75314.1 hypothetical protein [Photobacterium damselae subsp. damselae]SPY31310.1 Uncharacterised protein [Photobacterium damselae]